VGGWEGYGKRDIAQSAAETPKVGAGRAIAFKTAGSCCWTIPLSALDAKTASTCVMKSAKILIHRHHELYVTHDQEEALALSVRILVRTMGAWSYGTLRRVYTIVDARLRPCSWEKERVPYDVFRQMSRSSLSRHRRVRRVER
jgi:ABC-type taurine transport system ATPase subunit